MTATDARTVHAKSYSERMDLSGCDFISRLGQTKSDLKEIVGQLVPKDEMSAVRVPVNQITSMHGEVANEIHEFPKATLGQNFRCLTLQFLDERLITVIWGINMLKASRPWWNFWG